jgi:hypothetical protein
LMNSCIVLVCHNDLSFEFALLVWRSTW